MKKQLNNYFSSLFYASQSHILNLLSSVLLLVFGLTIGVIACPYVKPFIQPLGLITTHQSVPQLSPPLPSPPSPPPKPPVNVSRHVGLTEYLRPVKLMHDMTDEELLWRASMVPRIKKRPDTEGGVPRVAFMFLTKGELPFAELWEKFFAGHQEKYSVYVHPNPSFNESLVPQNSVFYGRRVPSKMVQWGELNMLEAERRLLANALLDFSNQRFILLSESCVPLFNFPTIYDYLINSKTSFVESIDDPGPNGRGRYSARMSSRIKRREWRKGSQWFEMDRSLAIEVISDTYYYPMFEKYCKPSCYVDEHFIPTFITTRHGSKNSNRTLTLVDWSRGGPHPRKYQRAEVTSELLNNMRSGGSKCMYNGKETNVCYLFARKFAPTSLIRFLKFAPKIMGFG